MRRDALTSLIDDCVPLVVLSPHLDDAVLSCGALITYARRHVPVTVVTLFTRGTPPPYTLSARRCLRLTGMTDAKALYRARRSEDRSVLERMGVTCLHAGFTEALFRVKPESGSSFRRRATKLFPELTHVYATYRLHVMSGRVARQDVRTLDDVRHFIEALARKTPGLILAPLGVGGHVDHVLVRTAAELCGEEIGYYSEFPYNRWHKPDPAFVDRNRLNPETWKSQLEAKAPLVLAYATQADSLFPDGHIPLVPEVYFLPSPARRRTDVTLARRS